MADSRGSSLCHRSAHHLQEEWRGSPGELQSVEPTVPAWRTEVTTANGSDYDGDWLCFTEILAFHWLNLVLALLGLAGNATVLWLLGFSVRRSAFAVYILNLAGADLLFLGFRMIYSLNVIILFTQHIFFSIPRFVSVLSHFSYLAGLSLLSAISTERCLSVLWPIWYRCHRPRHTSAAVCGLLWTVSLVLSLLRGGACGLLHSFYDYVWCESFRYITRACVIVSFVVLCGSSLALLLRIVCGSLGRIPVTRLYVTIVLTVLVFLLFGLPFGIRWLLFKWIDTDDDPPCSVYELPVVLSSANSSANPIIYFFVGSFRHRRFQRRTLKLILQRAMQDTPEDGECAHRGSSGGPRELETVSSRL